MATSNMHDAARRCRWLGMAMLLCTVCAAAAQGTGRPGQTLMAGHAVEEVLDLSHAWRAALEHDHLYRAAISEQAAAQTEREQGRAGLLPQVHAGYHRSRVTGSADRRDVIDGQVGSRLDYDSYNAYVQLQQPLLNQGSYAGYRRGNARADLGLAVFQSKRNETGLRLATAYFNTLLAYEGLALQHSLKASLESQVVAVEALQRQDEATRIDVQETVARLAVARADLIDAADEWTVSLRELKALLGAVPTQLAVLGNDFPLLPVVPATLQAWLDHARAHNPDVAAARMAVSVADAEVDVAASRYMPTTDLVAAYGRAKSEDLSTLSQRTNTFSIGIQISIPLFAGGYNKANVARARSDRIRLEQELRATLERTLAEVTRQYANVRAGADLVRALQAAVASGELSLKSARKGFLVGISSNLEVLKVQDRLYQTRYDLAKARLEYLLARLKLAAVAGELGSRAFDDINDTYLDRVVSLTGRGHRGSALLARLGPPNGSHP